LETLIVECEYALSPFSTETHKMTCGKYGEKTKEFDDSMY
jgi:hypothetical protein